MVLFDDDLQAVVERELGDAVLVGLESDVAQRASAEENDPGGDACDGGVTSEFLLHNGRQDYQNPVPETMRPTSRCPRRAGGNPAPTIDAAATKPRFVKAALLFALCLSLSQPCFADGGADTIWVRKSERVLHLLKDYRIVRSYPIALGKNPTGHKLTSGDSRTPEGLYLVDWRNPDSRFHLSLHISYPNRNDLQRARRVNLNPGGGIMIHGYPDADSERRWRRRETRSDWTDGCIALGNRDMREVWTLVADGTPILIDP